jgi:hypothetical protein
MEEPGGQQPPEFLSTPPSHGTRMEQLASWMPEAMRLYSQVPHPQPATDLPIISKLESVGSESLLCYTEEVIFSLSTYKDRFPHILCL